MILLSIAGLELFPFVVFLLSWLWVHVFGSTVGLRPSGSASMLHRSFSGDQYESEKNAIYRYVDDNTFILWN